MGEKYSIDDPPLLSDGTFGVTYIMRSSNNNNSILLRVVFITSNTPHKDELKTMKKLHHPNLLRLHGYYLDNKTVFLANELCSVTLSSLISPWKTKMTSEFAYNLFVQMSTGLEFLHSKNILHRDLRPENIFQTNEELIKLGNLGFNREQETIANKAVYCTKTPDILESNPCYMGPEVLQKDSTYTEHTDVWSLGCIFYEVLQGKPAFTYKYLYGVLNEEPAAIPRKYKEFKPIIKLMIHKNPMSRLSAKKVLEKIEAVNKRKGAGTDSPAGAHREYSVIDMSGRSTNPTFNWRDIAELVREKSKPEYDASQSEHFLRRAVANYCTVL